jgi:DNA invertase Pin-like site-specific DNA recombinase
MYYGLDAHKAFIQVCELSHDGRRRNDYPIQATSEALEAFGRRLGRNDHDTTTPAGRLLFHVLGSIAEFERDLIRERTAAGMRAAKRRGARIGRPEVTADRIALLQGIRAGASVSELARRLGVARATVRKLDRRNREERRH